MSDMPHMIEQFMWGYQRHFRIRARLLVEKALAKIGLQAEITAVLVGVARDSTLPHQVCIEPEDGPLLVSHLNNVRDLTDQFYHSDPDHDVIISDQRTHDLRQRGVFLQARSRAIAEAISASGVFDGLAFFVSESTPIDGYDVHTCVGVPSELIEPLPSFDDSVFDRIYVGRSLHDEVVAECLHRVDKKAYLPNPGSGLPYDEADHHLETVAARRFVNGTSYRATQMPADLFDMVNEFSSMTYERKGAGGHLVISEMSTLQDYLQISFREPVPLREARSMRKLLELSDRDTSVLADNRYAYGLGSTSSATNSATNAVEISITGHARWELAVQGQPLVRVAYGRPTLPKRPIVRQDFADTLRRTVGSADIDRIWKVIQVAQESRHGTTIVISADPEGESERLSGQALQIAPDHLAPDQLARLVGVDGAVLMGPDGRCHAFGVILDGIAGAQGDRARGSRFNSSVRYQQTTEAPSVIVVISDDGLVDLIPSLEPQVSRTKVEDAVNTFCRYCDAENVDGEVWSQANDAVERLAFYLNADQCQRVNESYDSEMRRRLESGGIALHRRALKPDPRMDESYFSAHPG